MLLLRILFCLGSLLFACLLSAKNTGTVLSDLKWSGMESPYGSLTFSGLLQGEQGDRYGYFFQMKRQAAVMRVETAVIDALSNQVLFSYYAEKKNANIDALTWQVGRAFLQFNPINARFIFGLKQKGHQGYNFKVDLLSSEQERAALTALRPLVDVTTLQTARINGHLQLAQGPKELFVTGSHAWFSSLALSKNAPLPRQIESTFCRFTNNQGFYSVYLKEATRIRGLASGFRDASGNVLRMTPFIRLNRTENECKIDISWPKTRLVFLNSLSEKAAFAHSIAGFSKQGPHAFCFVSDQIFTL